MNSVQMALNSAFAVLWSPFEGLSPWVPLWVFGGLFGVVALFAMKWFSNQEKIEATKRSYQADVLAIKLFRDDLGIVLKSMGRTLWGIARYLGHNLVPMAVMIVPFFLLFAQMQMRMAYRPLPIGEKTYLVVDRNGRDGSSPGVVLEKVLRHGTEEEVPGAVEVCGVQVDRPGSKGSWLPIRGTAEGDFDLVLRAGDETVRKSLKVGAEPGPMTMLSPLRSNGVMDRLLYPTEPQFDAGSFERVALENSTYPVRPLMAFGHDLSFGSELGMGLWFVVISILFAFALKGPMGVTF